jgi:hypothetical protein
LQAGIFNVKPLPPQDGQLIGTCFFMSPRNELDSMKEIPVPPHSLHFSFTSIVLSSPVD